MPRLKIKSSLIKHCLVGVSVCYIIMDMFNRKFGIEVFQFWGQIFEGQHVGVGLNTNVLQNEFI